ncbi:MAG: hypothetical protein Q9166_004241 [cf. Caloplaca sp. 2 TL-2023]
MPLLTPTSALPTYFGNEAAVSHMNVERAAVPEPQVSLDTADVIPANAVAESSIPNINSEGPGHWLTPKRREKRQSSTSDSIGGDEGSSNTFLDVNNDDPAPIKSGRTPIIENISSQGSDHWLGTAPRRPSNLIGREAAPEANPAVVLDMDYVPPAFDLGSQNLGAPRRRKINL